MQFISLEKTTELLVLRMREGCNGYPVLCRELLRLLSAGRPVAPEELASVLHMTRTEVLSLLQNVPKIEYDGDGHIVAAGLSLLPTPHHFCVNGVALFTWCTFDTLVYPALLGASALVESSCPVTGDRISMRVTPSVIEDLKPADPYISLVLPDSAEVACDIRSSFCNQVYFFYAREAALHWQAEHPTALILPVADAYHAARVVAQEVYLDAD